MNTLWQDVRYGWRMLAKSPGFTAVAVFTLALGIGANTGIFSVMRQVLLQRLPVPHPEQLVLLYAPGVRSGHIESDEVDGSESFSYPMYTDLRDQNTVFAGLAAKADFHVSIAFRGETERARAEIVSGNYFETLGVHPALGRLLLPSDSAVQGGNAVVVLGHGYWKKRFGGDTNVLNQSLLVNNQVMTVVGVVQPGFDGIQLGRIPDLYIPVTMKPVIMPTGNGLSDHRNYWIKVFGRRKPGISATQAAAALQPTYHALLESELPLNTRLTEQEKKQFVTKQIVLRDGARGRPLLENDTGRQLKTLMGMVGLVLLITCANVAGLLTARGAARQKEISVRLSVGASRWRLIRQLLIESCLLSSIGALLGLFLASWLSRAMVHFASANDIATGLSESLNLPVLLFTAALALLCGLFFGVAPAINSTRVPLASTLKEQAGALSLGLTHARLRKGLVISQVALTLLLVSSSWGFVRSLYNLKHVDLGFPPDHILQFAIAPQLNGYDKARSLGLFHQLEERLRVLPGVVSLSAAEIPLISGDDRGSDIIVEGAPADISDDDRHVLWNSVGAGHFSNLRIPLISGREFTYQDTADSPKVVVINETMAKNFCPQGQPLGKHMKIDSAPGPLDMEIVGVVEDSHHTDVKEKPKPFFYVPYTQDKAINSLTYYVRTSSDPVTLASSVRQIVNELDSSLPVYDVRSFAAQIDQQIAGDKLVALLATAFGVLAALLAAMGIYGLLAFVVTQRTREIGVRMALGAAPRRVGWMVLREVAWLAGIGILVGLPLAYGLSKLINSMLFGVHAFGLASIGIALGALTLVCIVATYAPSRRAMRIDPMVALRYE
jgi:putative ABC transport system permease protein